MAQAGSGRRLTGGEITVIVVVSALVVTFLVLLAMRLTSGGDDPGAGGSPTAGAPPSEEPSQETVGEDLSGLDHTFLTPSGNIACAMSPDRVVCAIADFSYEVPAEVAQACAGTVGHFLAVTAEQSSMPCDTSGQEPVLPTEGIEVLEYGQSLERGAFTCLSEETGVTCTHEESGHGLTLARAEFTLS